MSARGNCNTCGETFRLLSTSGKVPSHEDPFNRRHVCKGGNDWPESIVAARAPSRTERGEG